MQTSNATSWEGQTSADLAGGHKIVKRSTAGALAARKAQGERTRLEILRAADETFAAHGYQGTTMAAIAERSGVAVQTVYFYFHNKPRLLAELIGQAVMGFDRPWRSWLLAMMETYRQQ